VYGNGSGNVYGNGSGNVYGNGSGNVYGNGSPNGSGTGYQPGNGRLPGNRIPGNGLPGNRVAGNGLPGNRVAGNGRNGGVHGFGGGDAFPGASQHPANGRVAPNGAPGGRGPMHPAGRHAGVPGPGPITPAVGPPQSSFDPRLPLQDRHPRRPRQGAGIRGVGAPVQPPADRRIGGRPGQRVIRHVDASVDAPTEIVRRDSRVFAPGLPRQAAAPVRDRPARETPPRDVRRSRVLDTGPDTGFDVADPSALERLDRTTGTPTRGGRRHHRAGSRPASEFTGGGPTRGAKRGRRRRGTFWRELPMLMVVALVLTFLIQTFLARVYEIPSGSMETTLHGCTGCTNDRVLVDKLSYHFGDPSPGDVIVFAGPPSWQDEDYQTKKAGNIFVRAFQSVGSLVGLAPPDEKDLIKRVIAVGGQTVACCDSQNRVTVDGKPLNEPYIYYLPEAGPPSQAEFGPVKVPTGQLWVMGDSRNNSADSRVPGHGPIPVGNVIGKARFVVLPFRRAQPIHAVNGQLAPAAAEAH